MYNWLARRAQLEARLLTLQREGRCSRCWEVFGRITMPSKEWFHCVVLEAPGGALVRHEWHECPVCGHRTLDGYRPWNEKTKQWSGKWWNYAQVFGCRKTHERALG